MFIAPEFSFLRIYDLHKLIVINIICRTIFLITTMMLFCSHLQSGVKPVVIQHTVKNKHEDEGFVQMADVSVKSIITQTQQMYISVWAVSKVGSYETFGEIIDLCIFVYLS